MGACRDFPHHLAICTWLILGPCLAIRLASEYILDILDTQGGIQDGSKADLGTEAGDPSSENSGWRAQAPARRGEVPDCACQRATRCQPLPTTTQARCGFSRRPLSGSSARRTFGGDRGGGAEFQYFLNLELLFVLILAFWGGRFEKYWENAPGFW